MDANILIVAFLRNSSLRRILALSFLGFFAPEFLREEVEKHLPVIRRRPGLSESPARELLDLIEGYVTTIPAEALLLHWEEAAAAMADIDPNDVADVAAALAVPCDGVWSDDPHLRAQKAVPCRATSELLKELRQQGLRLQPRSRGSGK